MSSLPLSSLCSVPRAATDRELGDLVLKNLYIIHIIKNVANSEGYQKRTLIQIACQIQ